MECEGITGQVPGSMVSNDNRYSLFPVIVIAQVEGILPVSGKIGGCLTGGNKNSRQKK
jgi:hypothetical protein